MFRKLYGFYSNVFLRGIVLPFYYRLLRSSFKLFGIFAKVSLSQFSEDLIVDIILKNAKKTKGIFIDVGCNHPIEYNNTYLLYLRGWRGINIDGNARLISLYSKFRKDDINLNHLVSDKEEDVVFNVSHKDKLSTIDPGHINLFGEKNFPEDQRITMTTKTLNSILHTHHTRFGQPIDLLCIDAEGHDFEVLSSIDLDKYSPYLVVIEMHDFSIDDCHSDKIYCLLIDKGYTLSHFVFSNGYFIKKQVA